MKFLQDSPGLIVPNPSHFVRTAIPDSLIYPPIRIDIRRSPYPAKTSRPKPRSILVSGSGLKTPPPFRRKTLMPLMAAVSFPLPSLAAGTEQISAKINVESVLVSIDDFFNRYPYFVASLAFVWLVAVPLTQEYLKKYKSISCNDAFRKLRDDPSAQLLDIRNRQSPASLRTPNLKILNKSAVNLGFVEGSEEEFVKEVLKSFPDPGSTVICVLDNFDGNSLKVAKLLTENGFKEAYAIKGGLLGQDGWQEIQETLLPPSLHVYKKRKQSTDQADESKKGGSEQLVASSSNDQAIVKNMEEGYAAESGESSSPKAQFFEGRPLSPYPNYEDLKPPTSPTPSRSQSLTAS